MLKFFIKAWILLVSIGIYTMWEESYKTSQKILEESKLPPQPEFDTATSQTYQELKAQRERLTQRNPQWLMPPGNITKYHTRQSREAWKERQEIYDYIDSEIENRMDY